MSFEACQKVFRAAPIRGDERVLLEVQQGQPDLIAKEVCYHRACYGNYTNQKTLHAISERNVEEESDGKKGRLYQDAFSCLADEIRTSVLEKSDVMSAFGDYSE